MTTKPSAIILVLLCTILTSSAQILYKFGAARLPEIITNLPLISGLVLYGLGAVLLILSFRGGEVSVLYPFIATSYLWVNLLSQHFFQETLNVFKWGGIVAIILGISCIGVGSKKNSVLEYTEAV